MEKKKGSSTKKEALKIIACCLFFSIGTTSSVCTQNSEYLNQKPPGFVPKIFAPGLISIANESEFGSVFNKDATEFYYGVDRDGKSEIRFTRLVDTTWKAPKTLLSHEKYSCNDPFLSPDENRLYFISNRSLNGADSKADYDIWYIEREANGWSTQMHNAGPNINSSKNEYYISFTKEGSMYFSTNVMATGGNSRDFDINVSEFINDKYQKSFPLSDSINTKAYEADVFVAPDASYLIFCAIRKEGFGQGDLYISFKDDKGNWSKAKNMGALINTAGHELCPFVTKDGKYFFYTSNRDIYWVDATIIHTLRD